MSKANKNLPRGDDDRFKDALIFGYLEGKLSADQLEAFDAALCHDVEFSQRFIDTALLMQTLQSPSVSGQLLVDHEEVADDLPFGGSAAWESAVEDALASKRRSEIEHKAALLLAQDKVERNRETRLEKLKRDQEAKSHQAHNYVIPIWTIPVAIAAAIMLVAIPLSMLFQDKPEPNQQDASTPDAPIVAPYVAPVLATVVRTLDAQWSDDADSWNGTTGLREGRHHLANGLVEIELSEGTRVVLEAPVTFELTGTNALKLSRGRLVATVPPAAIGFTVETPSARIIDYGTEFGVNAMLDGTTEAYIFQGEISVAAVHADAPTTRLVQGESRAVNRAGQVESIAVEPFVFVREEEFSARYMADESAYHRWLAYRYELQRDTKVLGLFLADSVTSGEDAVSIPNLAGSQGQVVSVSDASFVERVNRTENGLRFDSDGDAFTFEVGDTLDEVTLMVWANVDPADGRDLRTLIASDENDATGAFHWNLCFSGGTIASRVGLRNEPAETDDLWPSSDAPFEGGRVPLGWHLYAVSINGQTGVVQHYLDGTLLTESQMQHRGPLVLGTTRVGAWLRAPGVGSHTRVLRGTVGLVAVVEGARDVSQMRELYQLLAEAQSEGDVVPVAPDF